MRIELWQGDITTVDTGAIVNAANEGLLPGGGVCGAIHDAAGPGLADACVRVGHCATGDAVATPGFALEAAWVIHAVGPVWRGGSHGEEAALASAYRRAVEVADDLGVTSVAFPAISTGIYGMPLDVGCRVAVSTLLSMSPEHVRRCVLVAFDDATMAALGAAIQARGA